MKAGVRFLSYDHYKQMLADPQVQLCCYCSLGGFSDVEIKGKSERAEKSTWYAYDG